MKKTLVIFDTGENSALDRLTVFPFLESKDYNEKCQYLGMSLTGLGFSMWGYLDNIPSRGAAEYLSNLGHLGKRISFDSIPIEGQNSIKGRMGSDWSQYIESGVL